MTLGTAYAPVIAADAPSDERLTFIKKTYLHLGAAILAFIGVEYLLVQSSFAPEIVRTMVGSRFGWLLTLGAFMGVSYIAERWARSSTSQPMQYAGLGLYVVAEAILFLPLLYIAAYAMHDGELIAKAGLITGIVFVGLTTTVFLTRSDFSWMRQGLMVAGFGALGLIAASLLFGFNLGTVFCAGMVVLSSGYILYYTSNVLHRYPIGSHVAAALALFSAIALLFWYVLRILMGRRR
jgi:FtsH-binding integral membrane protein